MYTIPTMPRRKTVGATANLSLRLSGEEAERYLALLDKAAEKSNGYADKTHVIRELMGLDPPKLLTKQDIELFKGSTTPRLQTGEEKPRAAPPNEDAANGPVLPEGRILIRGKEIVTATYDDATVEHPPAAKNLPKRRRGTVKKR